MLPIYIDSHQTVVFSFFSKKNTPPSKAALKSVTARSAVPGGARAPDGDGESRPTGKRELSPLAFADLSLLSESSAFGSAAFDLGNAGGERHPAVEEAAMLFANDQAQAACSALERFVPGDGLGVSTGRAWGMLFELYLRLGRRESFEALALDFAARFETSPPAWMGQAATAALAPVAAGGKTSLALAGNLDAAAAENVAQLIRLATERVNARVDVGKLGDVDNDGCTLLLNALRQIKKSQKEIAITGADHLIDILAGKIALGQRENEPMWLLLLELFQRQAKLDEYEETAVNYAVTFEVSPPAWETPKSRPTLVTPLKRLGSASDGAPAEGYPLEGEIVGAAADAFAGLQSYGDNLTTVTIDASNLTRIDFVSAGQLLNSVASLQMAGKQVRICGVSHLVLGLFEILGIAQMAEIQLRRS
jgi:ABC-type transporter Mla MlaB component